ncbi:hypothetical protein JL107_11875 [Nakamurella flavida]|uniref:Uncharacterized protein n=1 Tax=Nakamurella flavida TaxID=363630 RepID=A0A939C0X1_9ACTN|nr:hypothetical protein [Nakamurella flavida]MBM9477148.1 hypothetical protein [Nakamurella flavida]MDP9780095.1 hypothetical protein [Nakamurella flavida]
MRSDTGRHRLPPGRPGRGPAITALLGSVLIIGVALAVPAGAHGADPIDADPVTAFALVVDAPACTAATTPATVELLDPVLRAALDGCGLTAGQRIAVEYLRNEPGVVRLAGTSTSGVDGGSGRWVAAGLAVLALLAVLAVVVLVGAHRRGRPTGPSVTVADLITRLAAAPTPAPAVRARVLETAGRS